MSRAYRLTIFIIILIWYRLSSALIQAIYRTCLAGDSETSCGLPDARGHHVGDPCSRVSFAAELCTNLAYNSIFCHRLWLYMLFFIKMKLSICSRSVVLNWFGLGTHVFPWSSSHDLLLYIKKKKKKKKYIYIYIYTHIYIQVHLNKLECRGKVHFSNSTQIVKLMY